MIHIFHTPAAVLARRRERLAWCALLLVSFPGLATMLWAAATPLHSYCIDPGCDFTGIPFVAESAPPAPPARQHKVATPSSAPAIPELPIPVPHLDMPVIADNILVTPEEDTSDEWMPPEESATLIHKERRQNVPRAVTGIPALFTPPDYLNCPQPPYPPRLRRLHVHGTVALSISVAENGSPTDVTITASSGHPALDAHARSWVLRHWRFTPACLNGSPQACTVNTSITFALQS